MERRGLLLRLKERRRYASPAERNIIDFIQRDPQAVIAKSIRALADETFTSPSTVVRFARKLGCAGYKEFQRELVYELASAREGSDIALEDIRQGDSADAIVGKVLQSDVRSLQATERLLDRAVLDRCAELVKACRVVDLFGIGASLLVARDFEMKLARVDKECHLDDDWHNQLLRARNMHADDLAVVISYSGLTEEMVECARAARERHATVIAITRVGNETGLSAQADYVLGIASSEPLIRSGAMGSRMSQLLVIDALYAVYVTKDYERCSQIIRHNYIRKLSADKRAER